MAADVYEEAGASARSLQFPHLQILPHREQDEPEVLGALQAFLRTQVELLRRNLHRSLEAMHHERPRTSRQCPLQLLHILQSSLHGC